MQGLTKQNRAGEQLTGQDATGKPLPFKTGRSDWVAQNTSNQGDIDAYDGVTKSMMDGAKASSGGDKAAKSIETSRTKERPALVSKDGFVTKTDADTVADIRSRLKV
jgi:hypothetical protein